MKKTMGIFATLILLVVAAVSCSTMKNGSETIAKKITGPHTPTVAKNVIPYTLPIKKRTKRGRGIASEGQTPNGDRYRQNGSKPETGKSGQRNLQTWALLDSAGTTTVFASTGDVKAGTTEEDTLITKVSFKAFDSAGETVYNQQYNDLPTNEGKVSLTSTELSRHQEFSIQTHIKKGDSNRKYVVKTINRVFLLPDPAMLSLSGDDEVLVGQEAMIDGNLRELNSDTGVAGDCVLYVDGVEAKRINNLWVDAGDEVVCHFTQKFDSAGDKAVKIAFENASPTDWDATNNFKEKTLVVRSAESHFSSVHVRFYDQFHVNAHKSKDPRGYTYSYRNESRYQDVYFSGYSYNTTNTINANSLSVSVSESSGNNSLQTVVGQDLSGYCYSQPNYYSYCNYYDYAKNLYIYVQRHVSGHTYVDYRRYGHRTVYHNGDYYSGGFGVGCEWEEEEECGYGYSYGTALPISGNDWSINITVETSDGTLAFEKDFVLKSNSYYYVNQPWACYTGRGGEYCSSTEYGYTYQNCYYSGSPENAACQ